MPWPEGSIHFDMYSLERSDVTTAAENLCDENKVKTMGYTQHIVLEHGSKGAWICGESGEKEKYPPTTSENAEKTVWKLRVLINLSDAKCEKTQ